MSRRARSMKNWPPAVSGWIPRNGSSRTGIARPPARRHERAPEPRGASSRYLCFYPMGRKRDAGENWYLQPFADRQRMMHEHGMIGRKYGAEVKQVISGSIGFDDWSGAWTCLPTTRCPSSG